jgi:spore maturation protein CgeB
VNILLYRWKVFNQDDIKEAFEKFGHEVTDVESLSFPKQGNADDLISVFRGYDAVFTVNFFIEVSNACQQLGIPYIFWTVDSPMLTMYDEAVFNSVNYCFIFDKTCYLTFKAMGVQKIWYLPLAVNAKRLDSQLSTITEHDRRLFSSQISFVGGLYDKNSYDDIYSVLPEYLAGYFDAALLAQGDLYGDNVFDRIFTPDILERLSEFVDFQKADSSLSNLELIFKSTFLGYKHAQLTRIKLLNMLADNVNKLNRVKSSDNLGTAYADNNIDTNKNFQRTGVDLYSDKDDVRLIGVNYRGTVDYMHDMPKVFRLSDINLNLTMCNIRSGIPLRVWDIMGAGGFVLTNYQPEIPDFFENGKDLVFFDSFDDCVRKAEYYLAHEDERKCIAENGFKKVLAHHSYDARIEFILSKL